MVGWHHPLNGHEFEQTPGVGDGQGGLACCSPWGCKESDTTEQLTKTDTGIVHFSKYIVQLGYKQKPTDFTGILNPDSINLDQSIFL